MKLKPIYNCNTCWTSYKEPTDNMECHTCYTYGTKCQGRLSAYYSKDGLISLIKERIAELCPTVAWKSVYTQQIKANELELLLRELEGE